MVRGRTRNGPDDLSRLMAEIRDGLSQEEAGRRAGHHLPSGQPLSQSKISRAEEGRTPLTADEADAFARGCGATPEQRRRLVTLAAERHASTARSRAAVARNAVTIQTRIAALERDVTEIRAWQDNLILGELQTPDYRRAVIGRDPNTAWLEARAQRDRHFRAGDKAWFLIMFEGALRWPLGSYPIMAAQMRHLIDASQLPGVTLGIVDQHAVKPSPAPPGAFHLYGAEMAVQAAGTGGATFYPDPIDVATYRSVFDQLGRVAIYGDEARTLLAAIAADYRARGDQ